jgi:hypothetical protein
VFVLSPPAIISGLFAYTLLDSIIKLRIALIIISSFLILSVGYSQIYLGNHRKVFGIFPSLNFTFPSSYLSRILGPLEDIGRQISSQQKTPYSNLG